MLNKVARFPYGERVIFCSKFNMKEGIMSNKRTEVLFPMTVEEMEALSDLVNNRKSIRFNPDHTWTGEKAIIFQQRVDAELALLKAEVSPLSTAAQLVIRLKKGERNNRLDCEIEVALFKPCKVWAAVRMNDARTKLIYTSQEGKDETVGSHDWSGMVNRTTTVEQLEELIQNQEEKPNV